MRGTSSTFPSASARTAWQLVKAEPVAYAIAWIVWVAFYCLPLLAGVVLKAILDRVASSDPQPVWWLVAALAGVELSRWALFAFAVPQWHGQWAFWQTLPRINLLRSLLHDPGPVAGRLPGSPGEAVSRFRDDTMHIALVLDVWLDMSGAIVASAAAVAVMASVDAWLTVVVVVPVLAALVACRLLGTRLRVWRRREREATAAVTGFIGDTFGAITTVTTSGAAGAVVARFRRLGDRRAEAARIDQVATQVLQTTSTGLGDLGTGLLLILLVPNLAAGDASVGDVGLFASAVTVLAGLPRWAAVLGAYRHQADVSVERLVELLPEADQPRVAAPADTSLRTGPGPLTSSLPAAEPLERLDVVGLTVRHQGSSGGITDVDLALPRGSLTVITGPVGAGKSTLLRGLLGLVGASAGAVHWNGRLLPDPGQELIPPRAAYVAQVPRLFSEPLSDAILLGFEADGDRLEEAITLACLDDDIAWMPEGLATVVGAKGVRLSGGQIQRTAAARAIVRRPELLVIDDVSSALDAETEARMWDQLLGGRWATTLLVVSHRPAVQARADQVVVLEAGRRVA